jgi:hypothetical protein
LATVNGCLRRTNAPWFALWPANQTRRTRTTPWSALVQISNSAPGRARTRPANDASAPDQRDPDPIWCRIGSSLITAGRWVLAEPRALGPYGHADARHCQHQLEGGHHDGFHGQWSPWLGEAVVSTQVESADSRGVHLVPVRSRSCCRRIKVKTQPPVARGARPGPGLEVPLVAVPPDQTRSTVAILSIVRLATVARPHQHSGLCKHCVGLGFRSCTANPPRPPRSSTTRSWTAIRRTTGSALTWARWTVTPSPSCCGSKPPRTPTLYRKLSLQAAARRTRAADGQRRDGHPPQGPDPSAHVRQLTSHLRTCGFIP